MKHHAAALIQRLPANTLLSDEPSRTYGNISTLRYHPAAQDLTPACGLFQPYFFANAFGIYSQQ
jgi:hypothetical protein